MFKGRYEFVRFTQKMALFVHQTDVIRRSPFPYPYISKELYYSLGEPPVIEIEIKIPPQ